jgi:hypothetical protein
MYQYTFRFRGLKPIIVNSDQAISAKTAASSPCFRGDSRHIIGRDTITKFGLPTVSEPYLKYTHYVKDNPCHMGNCTLILKPKGTVMDLSDSEIKFIHQRRKSIKDLWTEYEERLDMYSEGLTHAGDVIGRRKFLIEVGETVPEIILNGYKCPKPKGGKHENET